MKMSTLQEEEDWRWMELAVRLAGRGLGQTAPNPAVGCVLVRERRVVGNGWTMPGGRPHAETVALAQAKGAARGATAYVTLEPCSHQGETPPCTDALIAAGVSRVVVALGDPDSRVNGAGIAELRAAGIAVTEGVCRDEAESQLLGYLTRIREGRPAVTLKLATSLDGKIATAKGQSKWITGIPARNLGHWLRAEHDAILTGPGTVNADDPKFTCRIPGLEARSPRRIILDSKLRVNHQAQILKPNMGVNTLILTTVDPCKEGKNEAILLVLTLDYDKIDIKQVPCDGEGHVSLPAALTKLGECGITSVLVEAGTKLATNFLDEGLVDKLVWFRAPIILGNGGKPAIGSLDLANLEASPNFQRINFECLGKDIVETYLRV